MCTSPRGTREHKMVIVAPRQKPSPRNWGPNMRCVTAFLVGASPCRFALVRRRAATLRAPATSSGVVPMAARAKRVSRTSSVLVIVHRSTRSLTCRLTQSPWTDATAFRPRSSTATTPTPTHTPTPTPTPTPFLVVQRVGCGARAMATQQWARGLRPALMAGLSRRLAAGRRRCPDGRCVGRASRLGACGCPSQSVGGLTA